MKFVLSFSFLIAIFFPGKSDALILASVNQKEITDESFRQALKSLGTHGSLVSEQPELRERFLHHLIDTHLRAQEASKMNLQNSPEFKSRMEQAETQILANLFMENYITTQTSESSLKKFFETNKELFSRKSVKISHAFFKDEQTAEKFHQVVSKKKENFKQILSQYLSTQENSEDDSDWFEKGSHVIALEKAAFSTPKGDIFPKVIQTSSGFHIVRVDDIRYYDQINFDLLKGEIKQVRIRDLQDQLSSQLKNQAKVTINSKSLENFSALHSG